MSFRCEECGKQIPPKIQSNKKVVKTRDKKYLCGSSGVEIVKELTVCNNCFNK